jgi:conjugal transfer pilus assembly protein TraB
VTVPYVKLQRISYPVGNDRYLVAKVEGYVTYKGKSGIRGRVVTREGNFANKAFVAGTLQGLGQAMSLNNQRNLTGLGGVGISTEPLTDKQIGQTALGEGVGNASSMLAEYYIKRAEQYQPVIEMPTGMDVELVFLDTFRFTAEGASQ